MEPVIDFQLHGSGTLYVLFPKTSDARDWIKLHIPADAHRMGEGVAIEHRYVGPILEGIDEDGLTVERL